MSRGVVAWLTDFGTRDHYVGAMKGVLLSIAPDVSLVDITHEIAPQDVLGGALQLAASVPYFPDGTVFVAVVDPGVGTARRAVAVRAGRYSFVGPDNGLLTLALADLSPVAAVELTRAAFALPTVSRTFEGRDRFAPAAGWLAVGTPLDAMGPSIGDLRPCAVPTPRVAGETVEGEVLTIDRFGNAITNVPGRLVEPWTTDLEIAVADRRLHGLSATYADAPVGAPCALVGSTGFLEIAVAGGHAASTLGLVRGSRVAVTRGLG